MVILQVPDRRDTEPSELGFVKVLLKQKVAVCRSGAFLVHLFFFRGRNLEIRK